MNQMPAYIRSVPQADLATFDISHMKPGQTLLVVATAGDKREDLHKIWITMTTFAQVVKGGPEHEHKEYMKNVQLVRAKIMPDEENFTDGVYLLFESCVVWEGFGNEIPETQLAVGSSWQIVYCDIERDELVDVLDFYVGQMTLFG